MRIAVDAMGGDLGSELPISGALAALAERNDLEIALLGPREVLEQQIRHLGGETTELRKRLSIEHAPEIIAMDESPVEAVRRKKNATIMV